MGERRKYTTYIYPTGMITNIGGGETFRGGLKYSLVWKAHRYKSLYEDVKSASDDFLTNGFWFWWLFD